MFSNMLPEEVIDYLINTFWNGYIPKQCRNCVFYDFTKEDEDAHGR
jgi:hypothetical protein